jgi:DNA repair exonuclease SbcCD ATPase subunit
VIIFRKVEFRNFLSTGNTSTEIILDKHNTTLVIGDNGSGKSTMLDALCFGLFGKAFRNIKKDQLVNSVNERDCKVEVFFDIGRQKFHIIRGIKPNRFEIYKNGKMLNQDASARDYQKHLENNILKLNYQSFTQVVILGSSSFVPFMQLTPRNRRDVVEEILDIKIFSMMNTILKTRIKFLKDDQKDIAHQFELTETQIDMAQRHIDRSKENTTANKKALEQTIAQNEIEIVTLNTQISLLMDKVEKWNDRILPQQQKLNEDRNELNNIKYKLDHKSSKAKEEITFFEENDNCPTCEQNIDEEFKKQAIQDRADKMITSACTTSKLKEELSAMDNRLKEFVEIENANREYEVDVAKKTTSTNSIVSFNRQLMQQIEDFNKADVELAEEKAKLKTYKGQLKTIESRKEKLTEDNNYLSIARQLLNDSGIKTKIIKRYLPVMNKLINSYLSALEFPAQFNLDEEFNETIKSRYRDIFSYANFSEGERMRIDLALLFTWRQIAKMKNSTNTNLLILDEIFDSSLDYNGTDEFLKIINTLSNENVFIISHKSDLSVDKFDDLIRFEKQANFSKVTT